MGIVAVLHHLVRLYGLVQNVADVSSLWEGGGRQVQRGAKETEEGERMSLGALATLDDMERKTIFSS